MLTVLSNLEVTPPPPPPTARPSQYNTPTQTARSEYKILLLNPFTAKYLNVYVFLSTEYLNK